MPIINLNNQNVFLFSDTHGKHRNVSVPEDVQIIIHCGDICNGGNDDEILDFFNWYSDLKIPYKIFVNGNHDLPFELEPDSARSIIPKNIIWLDNITVNINNVKIQEINPFKVFEGNTSKDDVDIIVSHYPAFGILDNGIGSQNLLNYILETKPKYFVFGHNHEDFGETKFKNIQFLNVSLFEKLFISK